MFKVFEELLILIQLESSIFICFSNYLVFAMKLFNEKIERSIPRMSPFTEMGNFSILLTMIYIVANTLKNQVSTDALLIYTEMLIYISYLLSILNTALDFNDCTSKQSTGMEEIFSLSVICLVFI